MVRGNAANIWQHTLPPTEIERQTRSFKVVLMQDTTVATSVGAACAKRCVCFADLPTSLRPLSKPAQPRLASVQAAPGRSKIISLRKLGGVVRVEGAARQGICQTGNYFGTLKGTARLCRRCHTRTNDGVSAPQRQPTAVLEHSRLVRSRHCKPRRLIPGSNEPTGATQCAKKTAVIRKTQNIHCIVHIHILCIHMLCWLERPTCTSVPLLQLRP